MDADLNRKEERRRFDRRSGNDRRVANLRRRRTDREELVSVDDEEAVRRRMLGAGEESRIRHVVEAGNEPVARFDEFGDRRPRLLMRWWALIRNVWGWK